ncbi:hypothetical protein A0256_00580 [Mucilaginibacter sp. PAMC 26640]|nr:hypothetical protein A0256_00580 [Mucilaginibacter sp. PAMC 26640]
METGCNSKADFVCFIANAIVKNLVLLPTWGSKYYQNRSCWKMLYAEILTVEQKKTIIENLKEAVNLSGLKREQIWVEPIEDRGSQITFSALGQEAPLEVEKDHDADWLKERRLKIYRKYHFPIFL